MTNKKGFLITFEGCEGSGKSTQAKLLKQYLETKNLKVILTREPGGSKTAEKIRNIVLSPRNKISPICELMLYEASRAQHFQEKIKPNLDKGYVVICDRFIDSTVAYQGYGRHINVKTIEKLNSVATEQKKPDLTIYLDIKPKLGVDKAKKIDGKDFKNGDRIERESLNFHNNVRKGFIELVKKYPKRIKKVKTNLNILKTQRLINKEIDKFFIRNKLYV